MQFFHLCFLRFLLFNSSASCQSPPPRARRLGLARNGFVQSLGHGGRHFGLAGVGAEQFFGGREFADGGLLCVRLGKLLLFLRREFVLLFHNGLKRFWRRSRRRLCARGATCRARRRR